MKLISFAVPCYNSENYMDRCVTSLLKGGSRVEIILVDDGSTDQTPAIADRYQAQYPGIIKVIHKENGGHGSGILAGLSVAEGLYYKVVDSDDWSDEKSLYHVLDLIEKFRASDHLIDLLVCNYVYEHDGRRPHTIHYRGILPRNREFTWSECGHFDMTRYIIMHSAFYRTEILKSCNLEIPLHTFYVDNVFFYTPLPSVQTLYYCDTDFYRYYIGRDDQSVNEKNIIKRIDQHILVAKIILEKHDLEKIRKDRPKLYVYMINYASMMVLICSLFLSIEGTEESLKKLRDFWLYIKKEHPKQYNHYRFRSLAGLFRFTNRFSRAVTIGMYRVVRFFYKFN